MPFESDVLYWPKDAHIGFIGCNSRAKAVSIKEWQNLDLDSVDYEGNLKQGLYNNGIAIRLGRCLSNGNGHGKQFYSFALDFDGWDAVVAWFGSWERVLEVAQKTRIEWHEDRNKLHMLFLSERPIQNRKIKIVKSLLEIKCENQLLFASPSIHMEGKPYSPLKTHNIALLTDNQLKGLEAHIDTICGNYISDIDKDAYEAYLHRPDIILGVGEGRHDAMKFIIIRYFYKSENEWLELTDEERFEKAWNWTQQHCKPPRSREEFDSLCDWTVKHHKKKRDECHKKQQKPLTQAGLILETSNIICEKLFHDEYQTPYAAVKSGDHIESLPLGSKRFKNVPNPEAITSALNVLKYKADFKGDMIPLQLRVAESILSTVGKIGNDTGNGSNDTKNISLPENDEIYAQNPTSNGSNGSNDILYDLTDKDWNVVRVTPTGWDIEKSPIIFRRYSGQIAQVLPSNEYDSDIFDQFINLLNVKDSDNKLLLKCYIIALFVPGISKAILMLHGDQGSAKTTLQELIKMLVDPSSVKTLAFPRDINEFVQKLAHNYLAYFDNVSTIPDWISDILCRAATGSGFSKRMLFSDDDDIIYNFIRCVGFNGINLAATKADLLDRGLIIQLSRISKDKRRQSKYVWADFEKIRPQLLGYIFDILVKVLATINTFELKELARMADFAKTCEAISRAMGYKEGAFIEAYDKNIKLQAEQVLESNIIAPVIVKFMEDRKEWKGSASELLANIEQIAEELKVNTKSKAWPKAPNTLVRRLNEVKTTFEEVGIFLSRGLDSKTKVKTVELHKTSLLSLPSLPDQNQAQNESKLGDDTGNDIVTDKKVSLPTDTQNHAQLEPVTVVMIVTILYIPKRCPTIIANIATLNRTL